MISGIMQYVVKYWNKREYCLEMDLLKWIKILKWINFEVLIRI